jgi:hypothetical protein
MMGAQWMPAWGEIAGYLPGLLTCFFVLWGVWKLWRRRLRNYWQVRTSRVAPRKHHRHRWAA